MWIGLSWDLFVYRRGIHVHDLMVIVSGRASSHGREIRGGHMKLSGLVGIELKLAINSGTVGVMSKWSKYNSKISQIVT